MLKKDIRNLMLKKRKKYTNNEINEKSNIIKIKLFNYFDFNKINLIHIFLPIKDKNEINTWLIIDEIFLKYPHIKIIVPVVDFNNKTLIHKYYDKYTIIKKNKYGIPEPISSSIFTDLNNIDIVLVPLLAFDLNNNRVGYGGGYYDKFLVNCKAKKIGLSLEKPIKLIKDINKYDIKMDYFIY